MTVTPNIVFAVDFRSQGTPENETTPKRRQNEIDRAHHRERIAAERRAELEISNAAIMRLGDEACRWPIGEPSAPDFRYCGAKQITGVKTSYCARHHHMAYEQPRPRKGAFVCR